MNLLEVKAICKIYGNGETAVEALKNTSKWGLNWQVPFGALAIIIGITILSTVLSVIRPAKTLNKMNVTDIVNAQ